jgi:hypothetical protein
LLTVLSVLFAVIAAGCLLFALAGMVAGRETAQRGFLLRAAAVLCFGLAVVLNVIAH